MQTLRLGGLRSFGRLATLTLTLTACAEPAARRAPLLDGMGAHHRPISTRSEAAQRYFNQGLVLAYGFNHAEAARSFREAQRQDPECAICAWGVGLALGPHVNAPMDPTDVEEAAAAAGRAEELKGTASEAERGLIEALALRFPSPPADRSELDRRYAAALGDLYRRFPQDLDVATLYAEALMTTTPSDYWAADGTPKPGAARALEALEAVLEQSPFHPGANHLYVHAVEARYPERGLEAAERLEHLVPGAGHLLHMPSHIYVRVGRYHDASLANERAVEADTRYVAEDGAADDDTSLVYLSHNAHCLWSSLAFEGRSVEAIEAARRVADGLASAPLGEARFGTLQHYYSTPLYAMVRFGKWGDILLTPKPPEGLLYPTGVWHYARTLAFVRLGHFDEAAGELEALAQVATDPALESVQVGGLNSAASLMQIAHLVADAERVAAEGDFERAIDELKRAIEIEDGLAYDEPPAWPAPVRQTLGVVLLVADRTVEAERIYREDLERFPDNGWSLFGLAQALRIRNDIPRADAVMERFRAAWRYADVELAASRM